MNTLTAETPLEMETVPGYIHVGDHLMTRLRVSIPIASAKISSNHYPCLLKFDVFKSHKEHLEIMLWHIY